jgi:hypothetical protein
MLGGAAARRAGGSKIIAASKTHVSILARKRDAALVIRINGENRCGLVLFRRRFSGLEDIAKNWNFLQPVL